jgi:predicted porin
MHRKALLFSLMAAAGVVLLVAVSAVTVYALVGNNLDTASVEQAVEVVPVQVEPVLRYEHANAEGKSGCRYSAKLQMTEAPAKQVEDEPLAQAQP